MTAAALVLLSVATLAAPGTAHVRGRLDAMSTPPRAAVPTRQEVTISRWLPWAAGVGMGLASWAAVGGAGGVLAGGVVGMGCLLGCRRLLARGKPVTPDPLRLAAAWDLLAACLRAGLPVVSALRAVAEHLPPTDRVEMRRAADLLALGADPDTAWRSCLKLPTVSKVARAARRSADSGAGLTSIAASAAEQERAAAADGAETRAQRATVVMAGPLGLCFLPAFVCLGVVPVVIGLADGLLARW